ncbi:alpha/beta superfamily hydrolase [Luminiphilus syltensis NOR5-1B]|uniref:Alpha/beta superfamily hydrolase n=1 Tax=Luminiphilus syltensis NOR5-1B TaxID=565045 RepID=B8KXF8_9GAMM|nr:hypothetical protein [Luminiphilus syltensis]EED36532.1 alpha/beta superfamily hydrolase [Luminiphilus syltensis NOR5-1B]
MRALRVVVGSRAAEVLATQGWHPDQFRLLIGASGGPKWFILSQLDRFLGNHFLSRRSTPLTALGSSIGSWRHACLAQPDPAAAIARLEAAYLNQRYSVKKPSVDEVSQVSAAILREAIGEAGVQNLLASPTIRSCIVTARGRGATAKPSGVPLGLGMGLAAATNAVDRRALAMHFQRVLFCSRGVENDLPPMPGFTTTSVALSEENAFDALMASGAIPFVIAGRSSIADAPAGQYWDGGIIDYHFSLPEHYERGLILYPHFSATLTPGWFDKFLPWRRGLTPDTDALVQLSPSEEFIASLPFGKIPDRRDFLRLIDDERREYWCRCIDAGSALAEEFAELVNHPDPLRSVVVLQA